MASRMICTSRKCLSYSLLHSSSHCLPLPPAFLIPRFYSTHSSGNKNTAPRSIRQVSNPSSNSVRTDVGGSRSYTTATVEQGRGGLFDSYSASTSRADAIVKPPSPESVMKAMEEDGVELELTPLEEAWVKVTESAEAQLLKIATREKNPGVALRVSVESGGCHGYQTNITLSDLESRENDDYTFAFQTPSSSSIPAVNVMIDATSLTLLKGSTIDFATELIGSSFRLIDNPQSKGAGCGCGVSWEAKE